MAIWNKKFDKKNGETRVCKDCNESFFTMRPIHTCKKCTFERYKHLVKRPEKKENYPFSSVNNDAGARFSKIRQNLRKAWKEGPEAVKRHYNAQLKEAEELGILTWIYDRRDDETKKQKVEKSRKHITNATPDTRGHYEE